MDLYCRCDAGVSRDLAVTAIEAFWQSHAALGDLVFTQVDILQKDRELRIYLEIMSDTPSWDKGETLGRLIDEFHEICRRYGLE